MNKKVNKYILTFIFSLTIASNALAMEMEDYDVAVLGALNKITGKNSVIKTEVNKTVKFGDLNIDVFACQKSSPLDTPESAAFLKIKKHKKGLFSGWMYASSPGISALEDGVYDIWVINCEKNNL
jgi:hypothetical protein